MVAAPSTVAGLLLVISSYLKWEYSEKTSIYLALAHRGIGAIGTILNFITVFIINKPTGDALDEIQ